MLLLSGLLLAGCSAKHPATSNPPTVAANPQPAKTHKAKPKPTSTANNYPIQIPKEGDFVVHGCTVTKENGNKADCVCRHAMTQLAVENPDKTIIQCR